MTNVLRLWVKDNGVMGEGTLLVTIRPSNILVAPLLEREAKEVPSGDEGQEQRQTDRRKADVWLGTRFDSLLDHQQQQHHQHHRHHHIGGMTGTPAFWHYCLKCGD